MKRLQQVIRRFASRREVSYRGNRAARRRGLLIESLESRKLLATVSLTPTKDNTLFKTMPGQVSNGAGSSVLVGINHYDHLPMRGLMGFDVAGSIPAGATINSVSLTVWVNDTFSPSSPTVELHKLLADWGEGTSQPSGYMPPFGYATNNDATWTTSFYPNTDWSNPGGDFSTSVSG